VFCGIGINHHSGGNGTWPTADKNGSTTATR